VRRTVSESGSHPGDTDTMKDRWKAEERDGEQETERPKDREREVERVGDRFLVITNK
jgi:hypothetical protein